MKNENLINYVPKDQIDKQAYLELVNRTVLGVDRTGQNRSLEDLGLFLYVAIKTGLDPLSKQIYAIYRWDSRLQREKMTIQASIDGLRLVAQRSNHYGGQSDAVFEEKDGKPIKASVTVYRINPQNGTLMPITASARWEEYVQTDKDGKVMGLWGSKPYIMLAKCAESLALRKAFPNEMSGIYTQEEMSQADNEIVIQKPLIADTPITQNEQPATHKFSALIEKFHNAKVITDEEYEQVKNDEQSSFNVLNRLRKEREAKANAVSN